MGPVGPVVYSGPVSQALNALSFLLSETSPSRLGAAAAEVAFVGRSNSGKSSLINALCRRDVARVSSTPGRTRTINVYVAGGDRWVVDLPGYGFAVGTAESRAGWGEMIEGYLAGRAALRAVFVLIDAQLGPTALDRQMLDWLRSRGLPWRVVAAKADRVKPSQAAARRKDGAAALGLGPADLLWISSKDGAGLRELHKEVAGLLGL